MTDQLKVLVICGSLRKGSYNAALARMAPKLAPPALSFSDAPSFAEMPIYNFDTQNTSGFPASATAWADAIRAALVKVGATAKSSTPEELRQHVINEIAKWNGVREKAGIEKRE